MFKNLTLYRYTLPEAIGLEQIEQALQALPFTPCSATQDKTVGFVPARGEEHGALVESVAGQWIAKLMIETKSVPASAIKKKAQAEADHIEATTGRKPGKKEMKALREDALLALLPAAFPRQAAVWIWMNRATGLLAIDASSQGKLDEAITALVRAIDSLVITPLHTQVAPQAAMASWLCAIDPAADLPDAFYIGRACELRSIDEEKAVVRFKNHNLDTTEVRQHITEGKLPRSVAMTWEGRLGFVLTEAMHIKQLNYLERVFEGQRDDTAEGFDADVALATGELNNMVPALIEALGGELQVGKEGESPAAAGPANFDGAEDPLFAQARDLVIADRKASISYVQRKLQIGYNRAARLLETLEVAGIVSPMNSSGVRDVLVKGVAA